MVINSVDAAYLLKQYAEFDSIQMVELDDETGYAFGTLQKNLPLIQILNHERRMRGIETMKGIRNKTAFVTGAEKGLGREIAKVFAREGANVVIFGLDEENGLRTEKDTAALGVRSVFIQGSVTSSKDLERAFALAKEKFGRIDFAVNCAGVANAAKKLHECISQPV